MTDISVATRHADLLEETASRLLTIANQLRALDQQDEPGYEKPDLPELPTSLRLPE